MNTHGQTTTTGHSSVQTEGSVNSFNSPPMNSASEAEQLKISALMANLPGMAYRCQNAPGWPMDFASEGALALTGYPASAFNLHNPFFYAELIHPADREQVWREVQGCLEANEPFTLEYRIVDALGREKVVWERGRLIKNNPNGEALLEGFIMDISERKALEILRSEKMEQELELQKVRKAESLSRLAGAVAHHFNNKMQAVIGCLELADARMLCMCGKFCEAREELQEGLRAALEATKVSRNLLTYLGKTMVEPQRISAASFFEKTVASTAPAPGKLECDWPGQDLWVMANPGELAEVLLHLLTNATEANPSGVVRVRLHKTETPPSAGTWIKPEGWKPAARCWACLEVTDQGPGIPEALREQLFDPFFSTKFSGRGLGLAMSLGIIHKMGGGIEVQTQEKKGTTFRVWMPCEAD